MNSKNFLSKLFVLAAVLLLAVCPVAVSPAAMPAAVPMAFAGELKYCAVNVGQGDCNLFMLPDNRVILIDAGTIRNSSHTVNYLKKLGVKKIDLLVATHPHEDHIGGMKAILQNFKVERIWDSGYNHGSKLQLTFYKMIKDAGIKFQRPKRGYSEKFGDVTVDVLSPLKNQPKTKSACNNSSIVLCIKYGEISFLTMGDIELDAYEEIAPLPRADILKVSHHGSSNASSEALLAEVKPKIAVLSYGVDNKYGHPHKEVVEAIRKLGIMRMDTTDGPIWLGTDGRVIRYDKKRVVK